MKFKNWNGEDLQGEWLITIKKDGIQCRKTDNGIVSKNGNPLYNFPANAKNFTIAEVFCGSWSETMSIVRSSKSVRRKVRNNEIYPLYPEVDNRLILAQLENPSKEGIKLFFNAAVEAGHEGLVLRKIGTNEFIKVKTVYTDDVKILGYVEGKGKHEGRLGKFITEDGDCGTGYSDKEREEFWENRDKLIGTYIEVDSMERTPKGKLRNPRFIRLRPDK
jgi:DNA ligase-1